MDHNVNALQKIYNKLVKNRINKIFEEENIDDHILDINVELSKRSEQYEDENGVIDYLMYDVNIVTKMQLLTESSYYIGAILINVSSYILTGYYGINVYYEYREYRGIYSTIKWKYFNDGDNPSEKESIENLIQSYD